MTYLNRDSAQKILNTRPAGTSVQDALKTLSDKGFTIEGYNDGSKGSINEPSTLQKIGGAIKNVATGIKEGVVNAANNINDINNQVYAKGSQEYQKYKAGEQSMGAGIAKSIGGSAQGTLQEAGQIANATVNTPIMEAVGGAFNIADAVAQGKISQAGQEILATPVGQEALQVLQGGMDKYNQWKIENPNKAKNIEAVINIASIVPAIQGVKDVALGTKAIAGATKDALGTVIKDTSKTLSELSNPLKVNTSGISPEIMNRVARINPTDANKFKNLTGKSVGEYLTETGNFGSPDTIIKNEAEKYAKALNAKDTAIASLPGTYKNGAMEDLIAGIKEKALATSAGNVKSPYLKTAINLENKLQTEGLTMKEISDAIRLYEKEIKLGYNKTLNPEKVQLATNVDRAARAFQDEMAKQLGFENLPELNKQIQTSRAIVDSLGKKIVSNDLLNGVSLTDYITLSGGNPASVGMFLTKKIFSDKGVQARIAKMFANSATTPEIKAVLGETKFPRLTEGKTKIPTQDLPIKLQAKGKTQSQADINLQKSLKEKGTIPENSLISEAKLKLKTTDGDSKYYDIVSGKNKIGELETLKDYFGKDDVHIQFIGIDESYRGQGISKKMLQQIVENNPSAKTFSAEPTNKVAFDMNIKVFGKPKEINNDITDLSIAEARDSLPDVAKYYNNGELDSSNRVFVRFNNPKSKLRK